MSEEELRWQPVLMILNSRLECKCGALAMIVTGKMVDGAYNKLDNVDVWCQHCFQKAVDLASGTEEVNE